LTGGRTGCAGGAGCTGSTEAPEELEELDKVNDVPDELETLNAGAGGAGASPGPQSERPSGGVGDETWPPPHCPLHQSSTPPLRLLSGSRSLPANFSGVQPLIHIIVQLICLCASVIWSEQSEGVWLLQLAAIVPGSKIS
jgi:hypothetical protein